MTNAINSIDSPTYDVAAKPLPRADVILKLSADYGVNLASAASNIRVKVLDYSNNPIAPEKIAYRVSFTLHGARTKLTYYPNTIGYQVHA